MTANGTEISDGESLSGSQVLRVYGSNLTPPYFSLWFNGVEYTPLNYGDRYVEYILQDNGTYEIKVDDRVFMSFEIEDVIVPDHLPSYFRMSQYTSSYSSPINRVDVVTKCLNYAHLYDETHPIWMLQIGRTENPFTRVTAGDFVGHNCSVSVASQSSDTVAVLTFNVTDITKVAWVEYQGFIIVVFNYPPTP